jgi:hypothetical protein
MASGPESSYRVCWPTSQLNKAVELRALAIERHVGAEFVRDFKLIQRRLASDPLSAGDPIYDYQHLGLIVHRFVLDVLRVLYAVDDTRRIVYVQEISAMPGRALAD